MFQQLIPAFRMMLLMTVLTGLIYPAAITGICQLVFPRQSNGSLVDVNGRTIGSSLIGQNFTKPEYFQPRPSAAGNDGYDGLASQGSNFGPTNQKLIDRVKASVDKFHKDNPDYTGPIPADLATASASGLDPHITPENAEAQVARVAKLRGAPADRIRQIVAENTQGRDLGFMGEPRVNVLMLNISLERQFPQR